MPKPFSCGACGRPIAKGNEHHLNGHVYGSDCIEHQIELINFPSIQPAWVFEGPILEFDNGDLEDGNPWPV